MTYSRARYNNIQRWDAINKATSTGMVKYIEDKDKWRKGEWSKWSALERQIQAEIEKRESQPNDVGEWVPTLVKKLEEMDTELSKSVSFVPPTVQARTAVAGNAHKNALIHLEAMRAAAWEAEALVFVEKIQYIAGEPLYLKVIFSLDQVDSLHFQVEELRKRDSTEKSRDLTFLVNFAADDRSRKLWAFYDDPYQVFSPWENPPLEDLAAMIKQKTEPVSREVETQRFKRAEFMSKYSQGKVSWADGPLQVANLSEEQETLLAHLFVAQMKSAVDYLAMQYDRDRGKLQRYNILGSKLEAVVTQSQQDWVRQRINYKYPDQTYTLEMVKYGFGDRLRTWQIAIDGVLSTNEQCDTVLKILSDEAACQTFGQLWNDPEWSTKPVEILSSLKYLESILDAHSKADKGEQEFDPVAELMSTCISLWEAGPTKLEGAKLKMRRLHGWNRHALHTDLDNPGPCDQKLCASGEFEYSAK